MRIKKSLTQQQIADLLLYSKLKLEIESKILELFKEILSLPESDKRAIINAYLKIKERSERGD
ncbi:MAG: hypothetical protein QW158_03685 [Nitrososphaerales archaeon]